MRIDPSPSVLLFIYNQARSSLLRAVFLSQLNLPGVQMKKSPLLLQGACHSEKTECF